MTNIIIKGIGAGLVTAVFREYLDISMLGTVFLVAGLVCLTMELK